MSWWLEKPMRLIQTNLREIDADLDPDEFVRNLQDFSANVVLFNAGGIVANYDTKLEFHYRNPFMRSDFMGEVIERTQAAGIRFMARFDFSKINQEMAERKPEWLYLSPKRERVNYNGQVHTCPNGGYQQDTSKEILGEVIDRYPIDAVFFNMIGYVRRDYSGVYHGICQCENCRTRFRERTGLELPTREEADDPACLALQRFCHETREELFDGISRFVKAKNPNIALCTYTSRGIDIWRKESNSGLGRTPPEWNYSASENTKSVLPVFEDKQVSNAAVHFVAMRFRHAAVPPGLTALRMAENIANAAWLDFYVIGPLERQDDRACFDLVRDLYRFYRDHEKSYAGLKSLADVCLIHSPANTVFDHQEEYRGMIRLLAESHILYDIQPDPFLETEDALSRLSRYRIVVIPDAPILSSGVMGTLDRFVADGGTVIATGLTGTHDQNGVFQNRSLLQSSGLSEITEVLEPAHSRYFRIRASDKEILAGFDQLDITFLHADCMVCTVPESGRGLLGYIPPHMYGPPEKCYYDKETDIPGIIVNRHGAGTFISVVWGIGRDYQNYGNHSHLKLLQSTLNDLGGLKPAISTDASPLVEINAQVRRDGAWQLISLVNHSGQNGMAFHRPTPMKGIEIRVHTDRKIRTVEALRAGIALDFKSEGDAVTIVLPELELLETLKLTFE